MLGSRGPSLSGETSPASDFVADFLDLLDLASSLPDFSSSAWDFLSVFLDLLLLVDFFDFEDFEVSYLLKCFSKMLRTKIIWPRRPPIAPTAGVELSWPSISDSSWLSMIGWLVPFAMNSFSISVLNLASSSFLFFSSLASLFASFASYFNLAWCSCSSLTYSFLSFSA